MPFFKNTIKDQKGAGKSVFFEKGLLIVER